MAESYKYLANGGNLYHPPLPTAGVLVDPHTNLPVGQDFPPEIPIRHPDHPYNPLVYKHQNRAVPKPGEESLQNYKVSVWDERTFRHIGLHPDSFAHGYTDGRSEALADSVITTHHSGEQVRYKIDPTTGMYVYRGMINPPSWLDAPTWGNENYRKQTDRSNYWESPLPVTGLAESNPPRAPVPYEIHNQLFYKPLPDNLNRTHLAALTDSDKGAPRRAGTARYDHTLSHIH